LLQGIYCYKKAGESEHAGESQERALKYDIENAKRVKTFDQSLSGI
jgi:myo-inositol-1-phosphate synthase